MTTNITPIEVLEKILEVKGTGLIDFDYIKHLATQALASQESQQKTFTPDEIKERINNFLPQADKNSSFFRAKQAILLELEELFTSFEKEI